MKCLASLACDRVIVDRAGAHSLINIMSSVDVAIPPQPNIPTPESVPRNAVVPTQWFIYSMWSSSAEDAGKSFEQVYQIYWPDGEKFLEKRVEFQQKSGEPRHQVVLALLGFPVGQPGNLKIITWLDNEGNRVSDLIEYSIRVRHAAAVQKGVEPLLHK